VFCPIFHACDEVAMIINTKDLSLPQPVLETAVGKNGTVASQKNSIKEKERI
jgi:hypothetical protein